MSCRWTTPSAQQQRPRWESNPLRARKEAFRKRASLQNPLGPCPVHPQPSLTPHPRTRESPPWAIALSAVAGQSRAFYGPGLVVFRCSPPSIEGVNRLTFSDPVGTSMGGVGGICTRGLRSAKAALFLLSYDPDSCCWNLRRVRGSNPSHSIDNRAATASRITRHLTSDPGGPRSRGLRNVGAALFPRARPDARSRDSGPLRATGSSVHSARFERASPGYRPGALPLSYEWRVHRLG